MKPLEWQSYERMVEEQRRRVDALRQSLDEHHDQRERILEAVQHRMIHFLNSRLPLQESMDRWDWDGLKSDIRSEFDVNLNPQALNILDRDQIEKEISRQVLVRYQETENTIGSTVLREAEHQIILHVLNQAWERHLSSLNSLKYSALSGRYGIRNPLVEFMKECSTLFEDMWSSVESETVRYLFYLKIQTAVEREGDPNGSQHTSGQLQATKALRETATGMWREALNARDEQGEPARALEQFDNAIGLLRSLPASSLSEEERTEITNDELIYRWEKAITHDALNDHEIAAGLMLELLSGEIPEARQPDDSRTVSAPDIQKSLLLMAGNWMNVADKPLNTILLAKIMSAADKLEAQVGRIWPSPKPAAETRCVLADFRLRAGSAIGAPRAETISSAGTLVGVCEQRLSCIDPNSPVERLESLTELARSYARLGQLECDSDSRRRFHEYLAAIRSTAGRLVASANPEAADTIINAADLFDTCGDFRAALELSRDALQLLAARDPATDMSRNSLSVRMILLKSHMGRPDQAKEALAALCASVAAEPLAKKQITQKTRAFEWWEWAFRSEMGESEAAWVKLRRIEADFETRLDTAIAPDLRQEESAVRSIRGWLTALSLNQRQYGETDRYGSHWEKDLRDFDFYEIDIWRRWARCQFTIACARYCMADNVDLNGLKEGSKRNQAGADYFGSTFGLVQAELLLLVAEIESFRSGDPSLSEVREAVAYLQALRSAMLDSNACRELCYTDRIRVATALSTAAAISLRIGKKEEARSIASDILENWLSFPPEVGRQDSTAWVGTLSKIPQALAAAIRCGASETVDREKIIVSWRLLPENAKDRYRRIFEVCGISRSGEIAVPANQ